MTETPGNPPRNEEELVELLHSVDVRAPKSLHTRVQAMAERARGRAHDAPRGADGMRLRLGALAAVGAVAGAALALALGWPGTSALSLSEAAAITLRPATLPAPAESEEQQRTAQRGGRRHLLPLLGGQVRPANDRLAHEPRRRAHNAHRPLRRPARASRGLFDRAAAAPQSMPADEIHWRTAPPTTSAPSPAPGRDLGAGRPPLRRRRPRRAEPLAGQAGQLGRRRRLAAGSPSAGKVPGGPASYRVSARQRVPMPRKGAFDEQPTANSRG